ncbi:MAG: RNA methyltransferase [Chitinispirillaceae bacterium]|nr:RNA methyltransferase [Chitinispirillaceae bacterium]
MEGVRAIGQIALCAPSSIGEILSMGDSEPSVDLSGFPVRMLTARQFKSLAVSRTPQGIAAVVKIPEGTYTATLPSDAGGRILLLEHVQDPGNVGTLIRTAAAFGYCGVVLSDGCADPFSPKAVQGSAGAVVSVWIRRTGLYRECAAGLKGNGHGIVAATVDGMPAAPASFQPRHVLMLGSEGNGLSPQLIELASATISIPIDRTKAESLNVAIAGGILMYCGMAHAD